MSHEEQSRAWVETYLTDLIAEAVGVASSRIDAATSFAELGLDSFRVLKLIKHLEGDFGTLPKTLLFENFNVDDLAAYFAQQHPAVILAKMGLSAAAAAVPVVATAVQPSTPAAARADVLDAGMPLLLPEATALEHPRLGPLVQDLFERYRNEAGASRGARSIAPNLFIGTTRRGYFNYARCKDIVLAYAYTGPDDQFFALAEEFDTHCRARQLQLNLFTDRVIQAVGPTRYSSTPFGALQRIVDLPQFTLEGGAMRRLRYLVQKFQKSGAARTQEYRLGTDAAVERAIADTIERWCAGRTMVNPLIHVVKDEILTRSLHARHRLFLTYLDEVLQNVILISPLSPEHQGYLMDLEFYGPEMPLGGLEFAIVQIVQQLVADGHRMLSLGGTYGCRLEACAEADAGIDRVLDQLHQQHIFNDDGNLQFKNKFRPENRSIYLCRAVGSGRADNIIDIIMMIADPAAMQTSDADQQTVLDAPAAAALPQAAAPVPAPAAPLAPSVSTLPAAPAGLGGPALETRLQALSAAGFNPQNLAHEQVSLDLRTDSWAQLQMPAITARVRDLRAQLQLAAPVDDSLRAVFPFAHFVLAGSGRMAEEVLYKAWPRQGQVLQNLLFPTGLYHQIENRFDPVELPCAQALQPDALHVFKGNLDLDAVRSRLAADASAVALVCVELSNNAVGGLPVSMAQLRELKALLSPHAVPLLLDATRVLENAQFVREHEPGHAGKSLLAVARELLSHADLLTCSLAKDFGIHRGGLIATNDAALARRCSAVAQQLGAGLDAVDRKLVALALQDLQRVESQVLRRLETVRLVWAAWSESGVPVVQGPGAHCVLVDVKRIPEFASLAHPVASFLAWLYLNTGIRAGAHSVGMRKGTPLNDLVRIALPVGLKAEQVEDLIARVVELFAHKQNLPDLAMAGAGQGAMVDVHAKYSLRALAHPGAAAPARPPQALATQPEPAPLPVAGVPAAAVALQPAAPDPTGYRMRDIAVIGMAGRYPKAENLAQMWANLAQGVHCVEEIPAERLARRQALGTDKRYRGGFIDGVDRFDSLFFNISPRDAEMMDPQERLFLEVAWEAMEDAGYTPETLVQDDAPRNVGVFVGAVWAMYQMLGVEERHAGHAVNPNSFLWSIANHVSYCLNLSGPSLTVDTACSSSLTALYLACEAIYKGECSAAIVGGVNLDLHQGKLDINLVGGALSKDGVCRSFGAGANGYVAGEGVGAMLVKPLEDALRDGDPIHGVIKGVAVNHGGKSSGYAVPSPRAQADVIMAALDRAQVDARSLGYIEAHGTGTELGDPVEIKGLSSAFEKYGVANQACAIGSVKTNIGHLEAAAGLVGLSKVLLQMQHRQLAPSLHSSELNAYIDFEHSPFYVVQGLEPWLPREVDGVRHPLRAGVSSFGAGGANAHVIVESHEPPASHSLEPVQTLVFPLSARTEEQLRQVALRLKEHLHSAASGGRAPDLQGVAHTLQVGRKAFEHRAAVLARTLEELVEGLGCCIAGTKSDKVHTGSTRNAETLTKLLSRKEQEEFVAILTKGRDAAKLAQLWVDGMFSSWRGAPGASAALQRVHLPTYPFADRRHWAGGGAKPARALTGAQAALHPMLDSNESTFERQLFKKRFHDRDFFIFDHCVSQIPTLPGVAYIELARKAGELATGRPVRRIKNILWLSPISVRASVPEDVLVELKPHADVVHFEVYSQGEQGRRAVHSQGQLLFAERAKSPADPESIDLAAIRARCTQVIDGREAYPVFNSFGLALGPSFQVLGEVHRNSDETLGRLRLPAARVADLQELLLHPSLLDGSLQAGAASQLQERAAGMAVPYSIGEIEILHPLQAEVWSYVTVVKDGVASKVSRANVLIVDDQGKVLVRLRETVGVPLTDVHKPAGAEPAADEAEQLHYSPAWRQEPLPQAGAAVPDDGALLFFGADAGLAAAAREHLRAGGGKPGRVVAVSPGTEFTALDDGHYRLKLAATADITRLLDALEARQLRIGQVVFHHLAEPDAAPDLDTALDQGVHTLLGFCQALATRKLQDKLRLLHVYRSAGDAAPAHHEAINGFANALRLEHPKVHCRTVELHGMPGTPEQVAALLLAEARPEADDAHAVRYAANQRWVRRLHAVELPAAQVAAGAGLRQRGVYLITGGAGGLGLLFAEFLARECQARLVLTGRSELSAQQQARLAGIEALGAEVLYLRADVAEREQVAEALDQARQRFGALHGVIHSAGVLRDAYIRNKTRAEMQAVFAPKVQGTQHLDELTQQDALDFFVLFSSMSAVGGNPGQSDYCYANHYMDSYAVQREALRAAGRRSGKTLSINWSLWAEGGMKLDAQTEQLFRKATGIRPLRSASGLQAFVRGLASDQAQLVVVEGSREMLEVAWGLRKPAAKPAPAVAAAPPAVVGAGSAEDLVSMLRRELSQIAMDFLKLDASDIQSDKILLDLGFDSIGLATYANQVNDKFGLDITPILFFDYPSIEEIAKHLAVDKRDELLKFLPGAAPSAAPAAADAAPVADVAPAPAAPALHLAKGWNPAALDQPARGAADGAGRFPEDRFAHQPIAIVGMSGVMPQCEDLEAFWEGLRDAKDLVSLIPEDRWRWEDHFGDPLKEPNKTNSKWGGFMQQVDKFDPLFFGISPREAQMMDPQQRIFLQTVWEAVEDSGHKVSDLAGTKTGLFVGVATNDYVNMITRLGVGINAYTASGNSHSVLANRVSFLLNLRGPSAPIDTACSSSLIALHRAIESIHTGSCEMAIVGGVQVMLTPAAYVSFSMAGMLSGDGKCKTFDKSANGYVRGEGSGAIFIKTLAQAEADGDHIYAVVRATAENHGGRVTTLTAPNASAQADLLVEAYTKAGFDPGTVGFIECHGTGTSLGDPIEVQALSRAFAELYKQHGKAPAAQPHCGLSSVKTNIGHLETAAGVAGIIKALLALKHKQIPANLHFEELNPYINLKGTPFFVAKETTPWASPLAADGRVQPRRAGVSSFGFGGANAHVVLEEYLAPPAPAAAADEARPRVIVLSAKNEERLQAYAAAMLGHLERHQPDLDSFAYTLQVGRDAYAERLAFVAPTADALRSTLAAIVHGTAGAEAVCRNNTVRSAKAAGGGPATREQVRGQALRTLLQAQGAHTKLAQLWAEGAEIEWALLYEGGTPRRAAVPTYPFAQERCWISAPDAAAPPAAVGGPLGVAGLHPLVHRNTSTLQEQRFTTRLSGQEFFLQDHMVETQRVLPGVAYMEMASAAGQFAAQKPVRYIRGLVWLTPLIVGDDGAEVEISLSPRREDVDFWVKSYADGRWITHCTGRLGFATEPPPAQGVDIAAIRARCVDEVLTGETLYAYFAAAGLKLGRSFQIVQRMWASESESIALLQLPAHIAAEAGQFSLHPALMDGSLHSAIGLMKKGDMDPPLSLPFSVGEVEVFRAVTEVRYGYATWSKADAQEDPSLWKVNFLLLDGEGQVLVRIQDFVSKPLHRGQAITKPAMPALPAPAAQRASALHSMVPVWRAVAQDAAARVGTAADARVALVGGSAAQFAWLQASFPHALWLQLEPAACIERIAAQLAEASFDQLLWMAPDVQAHPQASDGADAAALVQCQEDGVLAVFRITKALLQAGHATRKLQWTLLTAHTWHVHAGDTVQPAHAAVAGYFGSLALEFTHWQLRLLDVDGLQSLAAQEVLSAPWHRQGRGLARRRGEWFQQDLALLADLPVPTPAYRQGGVYVVLGGAGGIGEVLSRHLIEHCQAQMLWIGRRPLDAAIEQKMAALAELGPAPQYFQADATDLAALQRVAAEMLKLHPAIHGVVHSALVLRDQSIAQMDMAGFQASLRAKLDTSVHLDQVFGGLALDFMLFFSSILSFNSSPGQANYAAGCAFKDGFARQLQARRPYPVKTMNWGYWGNVGVVADAAYLRAMEAIGIGSIEPAEGMARLDLLLGSPLGQLAVLKTLGAQAAAAVDGLERVCHLQNGTHQVLAAVREGWARDGGGRAPADLQSELPSPEQDALVAEILLRTLLDIGLLDADAAAVAARLAPSKSARHHARWLQGCVRYLQDRQLLDAAGRPQQAPRSLEALWADWAARRPGWIAAHPNHAAQTTLLESCLQGLPGILSGRQAATEVMFPRASMHLVEGVYRGNALADHFNAVLRDTLVSCIRHWLQADPQRKIRILEIGAGTGGTTAALLPALQDFGDSIAEYCYSDVSKAFLMHASKHFQAQCPALTTVLFDVCKPLAGQAVEAGRYDLVVAANVLHATPSIRETVRNAKAALKPQGVLLLNEISCWSAFSHLTFGLLEGWWLYEDTALRLPHCPGVAPAMWERVLGDEGYAPVFFPAQDAQLYGQQIVAAASDGVLRQRAVPARQQAAAVATPAAAAAVVATPRPAPAARQPEVSRHMARDTIKKLVAQKLSEALQLDPGRIRNDEPFAEYGVDSIVGVNLVRSICDALQIELETTALFEYSTVDDLAEYIHGKWGAELGARLAPAARGEAAAATAHEPETRTRFAVPQPSPAAAPPVLPAQPVRDEPIAIIGMSGRFADSESVEEFWLNLRAGQQLVKPVTRWDPQACVLTPAASAAYCSQGSFIESVDRFDPGFFRISQAEAVHMDPQQRLFLEECWKALEDAGYANKGMQERRCGVFVGCGSSKYDTLMAGETPAQAFWGNSESVLPARIAYFLDLQGPAIAVNTACSSSLVTIHLACQSLRAGETQMALAGGVFLQPTAGFYQVANRAGMLSPQGRCFAFDARADGFVPGEGVGVIVLKRMSDALRDGDHIHGVVAGSGVNQDGSSNGLIAPNAAAQERLEREVYERHGIDPASIQMLEAHGTGTLLGDSIEFSAVSRAFRKSTDKKQFCAIGSVKTNIGHAATAAGVAGVIKVLLAMRHRELPPSLNFERANPGIDLAASPFFLNTEVQPWQPADGAPRRAAISSFGFSGTNAHLVIDEAPKVQRPAPALPGHLVLLSARTSEQVRQQAQQLQGYLQQTPDVSLNDLAYTLFVGRMHLGARLACVVRSPAELQQLLQQWLDAGAAPGVFTSPARDELPRERASLRKYGNFCIQEFHQADADEALEHLATIADLYVQGYALDYQGLFAAGAGRIALPTYPFARERYWVDAAQGRTAQAPALLHPLLHVNTSDLRQVSFSTTFHGRESFLAGQPALPALVQLEMLRAAVQRAAPRPAGPDVLELRQVVWGAPVLVDGKTALTVALLPGAAGGIGCEIYSAGQPEAQVHCQAQAVFDAHALPVPAQDIARLRARMQAGVADGDSLYAALSAMGQPLGAGHRTVLSVYRGQQELLAHLQVPEASAAGDHVLHPALADAALQACLGLLAAGAQPPAGPLLPQALQTLRLWAPCKAEMHAWVRQAEGAGMGLDLDLLDADGRVCAELRGLSFRAAERLSPQAAAPQAGAVHPAAMQPPASAQAWIEAFLRQAAAAELNLPATAVDVELSYFDLGFTSMGVTQFVQKTNTLLALELPPAIVFEYPTIRSFATRLSELAGGTIRALATANGHAAPADGVAPAAPPPAALAALPRRELLPANGGASTNGHAPGQDATAAEDDVLEQLVWTNGSEAAAGYEKLTF